MIFFQRFQKEFFSKFKPDYPRLVLLPRAPNVLDLKRKVKKQFLEIFAKLSKTKTHHKEKYLKQKCIDKWVTSKITSTSVKYYFTQLFNCAIQNKNNIIYNPTVLQGCGRSNFKKSFYFLFFHTPTLENHKIIILKERFEPVVMLNAPG